MSDIVNKLVEVRPSSVDDTLPGLFALRDIGQYEKVCKIWEGKVYTSSTAKTRARLHLYDLCEGKLFANCKNCPFNGLDLASFALDYRVQPHNEMVCIEPNAFLDKFIYNEEKGRNETWLITRRRVKKDEELFVETRFSDHFLEKRFKADRERFLVYNSSKRIEKGLDMVRSSGDWTDASSLPSKLGLQPVADLEDHVGETPIDETRPLGSRSATMPSSTMPSSTIPSGTVQSPNSLVTPSPDLPQVNVRRGGRFPRSLSDDLFTEPPVQSDKPDTTLPPSILSKSSSLKQSWASSSPPSHEVEDHMSPIVVTDGDVVVVAPPSMNKKRVVSRRDTLSDLLPTSSPLSVHRHEFTPNIGELPSSGGQTTVTSKSSPPADSSSLPSISVNMYTKADGFLAERVDKVEEPPIKRVRRT